MCQKILKSKLLHIGIHNDSVNMIMDYLNSRWQYVQINNNSSEKILTGKISVSQGSVISGILYLIYTLDMPLVMHDNIRDSLTEYSNCKRIQNLTYIDDCFVILEDDDHNIWKQTDVQWVYCQFYFKFCQTL